MAKYHEMGRFAAEGEDSDLRASVYHERQAAELGIKEAILTMAQIYLGLPHDVLVNVVVQVTVGN